MEIKIVKSTTSLSGYSLMDGDVTLDINDVTKDGKSLILPENSSGRKFWAISKVEKGNVNVTEKSASQGTEKKSKSSINLEEDMKYLTKEEQELFKKFLAKIEKGKLKEKLEAEKADLLQKLADLEADLEEDDE